DDVALRLNPYPTHYRSAFAFSAILYPAFHRHSLRSAFLSQRRRLGLPRSTSITRSVRSRLDVGGLIVHDAGLANPHSDHTPFWSQRFSLLRCSVHDGACTAIQIS